MPNIDTNLSWTDDRTPLTDDPNRLAVAFQLYDDFHEDVTGMRRPSAPLPKGAKRLRSALHKYEKAAKSVATKHRPSKGELYYNAANTIFDVRRIAGGVKQKDNAGITPPLPLSLS